MDMDDQLERRPVAGAAPMGGVVREFSADERRPARVPKPAGPRDGEGLALIVEAGLGMAVSRIAGSTLRCVALLADAVLNFAIPPAIPLHRVPLPEKRRSGSV